MPLHPELSAFLELADVSVCTGQRRLLHELTPAQAREEYDRASAMLDMPRTLLPRVEMLSVPTRDGATLRARLYSSRTSEEGAPEPVLLFFHGGGFVVGSLNSHDGLCRSLARRTPCAVLSLDYRLAPEYPFPTAINDAVDALIWLRDAGLHHQLDTKRIAVGGDSAGGTIATVLAVIARDNPRLNGLGLVTQLLLYPSTSSWQNTPSHRHFAAGYLLEAETIRWFFHHYLRDDADRDDWRFAPLIAPNVAGVAPAHIILAEHDPLVDEGLAYARKLEAASVPVSVSCQAGMLHDFMRLGSIIPAEVSRAHTEAAQALARAFVL